MADIALIDLEDSVAPENKAAARAVVAQAFADHPGAGVVALDGAMLDRPHLALAQRLLAEADSK